MGRGCPEAVSLRGVNEGSSDGKRGGEGSVSKMDGASVLAVLAKTAFNDCSGVLSRGDGWNLPLGGLYLGEWGYCWRLALCCDGTWHCLNESTNILVVWEIDGGSG